MGHIRLGYLPRTREWKEVVDLMNGGANAKEIAAASLRAIADGLRTAPKDRGVLATVRLLLRMPIAAREPDFSRALRESCSIHVPEQMTFTDLLGGMSDAIDTALANNHGRTDLGEMAQMAAVESLSARVGADSASLFGTSTEEVRSTMARYRTVKNFGSLARSFFGRLVFKTMDYFLSRFATDNIGRDQRFGTLAEYSRFTEALELHCRETAIYVETFSGEWAQSNRYDLMTDCADDLLPRYIGGAVNKMLQVVDRESHDEG